MFITNIACVKQELFCLYSWLCPMKVYLFLGVSKERKNATLFWFIVYILKAIYISHGVYKFPLLCVAQSHKIPKLLIVWGVWILLIILLYLNYCESLLKPLTSVAVLLLTTSWCYRTKQLTWSVAQHHTPKHEFLIKKWK